MEIELVELEKTVRKKDEEILLVRQINAQLDRELKTLRFQMDQMIRQMYGQKSEKLDKDQLLLEDVILDADGEATKPALPVEEAPNSTTTGKKKKNGRRPLPDHLPRHEIIIDIPENEKICPLTGQERPLIGYEESTKLEYIPETLRVNVYKRATYGSPVDGEENGVVTASMPAELLPRCLADAGMLAHMAVSKFDDHLPLYRMERMLLRQGIHVSRKTMSDWLAFLAKALRPLEQRIHELLLEKRVIHHDDTPLKMLDPGAGKTKETRLWVAVSGHGPPLVQFCFSTDRKQSHPIEYFKGYTGSVMCDEYAGYANIDSGILQSCWAHARRYVEKAKHIEPAFAQEVLLAIAALYKIEKAIASQTDAERQEIRELQSTAQLQVVFDLIDSREFRPASPMYTAQKYLLKNRDGLSHYAKDQSLPIDNNPAERAIRRVAIGRKNWLFLGSETGGQTAATLMTLLGSCWANQLNAFAYLETIIRRLPTCSADQLDELLPHRWAEAHPEHLLPKQ